jgi:hypothetical protein
LCASHFSRARARRASSRFASRLGTLPRAAITAHEQFRGHRSVDTTRNFRESQRKSDANVGSGARPCAAAASSTKQISESGNSAEIAHEDIEGFGEIDVMVASAPTAQSGFAESIVSRALVRIAEDVVRLSDLLELRFRLSRAVVAVRMKLHRHLSIGALYLIVGRGA